MIEHQTITVSCDFCEASYETDRPVLKSGWQHVTVDGRKGLVACPREVVEQKVSVLTPEEAMDRYYEDAVRMANRAGANIT